MKITIINGPNLNMLGTREPSIYGNTSFEQYLNQLCRQYPDVEIDYYQSNVEGVLIDKLQDAGFESDGIILNAGAYTHLSGTTRLHTLHQCTRHRGTHQQRAQTRGI